MSESFLTVEQVLRHLPLGRTKFFELVKTGQIKTVRVGTRRFVTQSALDDFIDRLIGE